MVITIAVVGLGSLPFMRRPPAPVVVAAVLAGFAVGALSACGSGQPSVGDEARVIDVTMTDNRFNPADIEVTAGEAVVLRFRNDGEVEHEALIGTAADQDHHGDDMGDMADMGGAGHSDVPVVQPGDTLEIPQTFDEEGSLLLGCHLPGHYESGMKAVIDVT